MRQIIQVEKLLCQVYFRFCLIDNQNFTFDQTPKVLYNYCIDEQETNMTITEFFADFHESHSGEFVEAELCKIFQCTIPQDRNFDLDVPF